MERHSMNGTETFQDDWNMNVLNTDDSAAAAERMYWVLQREKFKILTNIYRQSMNLTVLEKKFYIDGPGSTSRTFVYYLALHSLWPELQSKMYGIYWNWINSIACWTKRTQNIWPENSDFIRLNFYHKAWCKQSYRISSRWFLMDDAPRPWRRADKGRPVVTGPKIAAAARCRKFFRAAIGEMSAARRRCDHYWSFFLKTQL